MFTPIGSTVPQPLTLVATALPNSVALRVPEGNVAPSISSAELNNNASGNRNALPKADIQALPVVTNSAGEDFSVATNSNAPAYNSSSQTAFLAQLASGDISPEVHGIFVQYEKLLSYANVKYKPSNAGKPVEPVSVFSTLLELEKADSNYTPPAPVEEKQVAPAPVETPVTIDNFKPQEPQQPVQQIQLPQAQTAKYTDTVARNSDIAPKELEVA